MKIKLRNRFIFLIVLSFLIVSTFVYAALIVDSTFSDGSFSGVYYNSSIYGIVLNNTYFGSYSSAIYDSGSYASWNFNYTGLDRSILVLVDKEEDVWKSVDLGKNWFTVNTSFSGDTDDALDFAFFNNTFYLVDKNEDVFSSSDFGHSWKLVFSNYNGPEGDADVIGFDSSNFYIFEADKEVWKSSNLGLNWTKINSGFTSKSIQGFASDGSYIYVVDSGAVVWKSLNDGLNWSVVNSDYNLGSSNSADDLSYYSGNFYILDGQDIWRSNNSCLNFSKVTDDFNVGDSNSGITLTSGFDGVFVVDGSEDVYASYDFGENFVLLSSNINAGGSNVISILSYDVSYLDVGYSLDNSRYFSYVANFSSLDLDYSPVLYNVSIGYDVLNTAPNFTVNFVNSSLFSDVVVLNVSVWDYNGDSAYVWFYGDSSYLNYSYVLNGSTVVSNWNTSDGEHFWYVVVNDSDSVVSSTYSFVVNRSSSVIDAELSVDSSSVGGGKRKEPLVVLSDEFSPNVLIEGNVGFEDSFNDVNNAKGLDFSLEGSSFDDVSVQNTILDRFTGQVIQALSVDESKYSLILFGLIFIFSVVYHYGLHHGTIVKHKISKKKIKQHYIS